MRPTRIGALGLAGALAVPVAHTAARLVAVATGRPPGVSLLTAGLLGLLAVLLVVAARRVRAWTSGTAPLAPGDALRMGRLVALAKAASLFGAIIAGASLGVGLAALDSPDGDYARALLFRAVVCTAAALAVAAAGLGLERSCRAPGGGSATPGVAEPA
jgi:hypothetical protein